MTYPFNFTHQQGPESKVYVSGGRLPSYIDPAQPPTKKSPWRQIGEQSFYEDVKIIMPEGMYNSVWTKMETGKKVAGYSKVFMKLQDVLEGEFFNEYVKRGNVLMLSDGRPGVDNVFSLQDGVLRLHVDNESYQRAGLQGKPVRGGGRKHIKAWYLIEVELRLPSMLHGKKGFERVVWAAKHVLNDSKMWLFTDLQDRSIIPVDTSPIRLHHPTQVVAQPVEMIVDDAMVPTTVSHGTVTSTALQDEDQCFEIMEWLDLVSLKSPRVMKGDALDPYLSRYRLPEGGATESRPEAQNLVVIQWKGLISTQWLRSLLLTLIRYSRSQMSPDWMALVTSSHQTSAIEPINGSTTLLTPANLYEISPSTNETSLASTAEDSIVVRKGLSNFLVFQIVDGVA